MGKLVEDMLFQSRLLGVPDKQTEIIVSRFLTSYDSRQDIPQDQLRSSIRFYRARYYSGLLRGADNQRSR